MWLFHAKKPHAISFFWLSYFNQSKSRNQSSQNLLTLSLTADVAAAEVLGFGAEASSLTSSSSFSNGAVSVSDDCRFHLLDTLLKTEYIPFTQQGIKETAHAKNENVSYYA